jgi:hypothetical protein
VFLVDAFHGNAALADSVNRLLVVGFYLVNIGYVALAMQTSDAVEGPRQAIELVCGKIGLVLLVLGAMHFSNLYVFSRLRKRGRERNGGRGFAPGQSAWGEGKPLGKVLE